MNETFDEDGVPLQYRPMVRTCLDENLTNRLFGQRERLIALSKLTSLDFAIVKPLIIETDNQPLRVVIK